MNLNKNDIFAIIAILISLGIPVLSVLNRLDSSIVNLNEAVAIMALTTTANSELAKETANDFENLKDTVVGVKLRVASLTEHVKFIEKSHYE